MYKFSWIKVISMFLTWAILLSLLPLQQSGAGSSQPPSNLGSSSNQPSESSLPSSQPSSEGFTKYHKVSVSKNDQVINDAFAKSGALLISDHRSNLWRVSEEVYQKFKNYVNRENQPRVRLKDDLDLISQSGIRFNTQRDSEPAIPANLRQVRTEAPQMWIIQYISESPHGDGWQNFRIERGLERVTMAGRTADVVWVDNSKLTELETMANPKGPIQWTGPYHPIYRVDQALKPYLNSSSDALIKVLINFYPKSGLPDVTTRLQAVGSKVTSVSRLGDMFLIYATIQVRLLTELIKWPDLMLISPDYDTELADEAQGQIVAGNILTNTAEI